LLSSGEADPNEQDKDGWTPLHYSTRASHIRIVRLLLSHPSINVNVLNNRNQRPLFFAMNPEIRDLLLEKGAYE